MEDRDSLFSLEYLVTNFFIFSLLLFFPQEAFPARAYLVAGIIIGALISYITFNKFIYPRKIFTLAASLLVLGWGVYYGLKSSFLYREIIVICINSVSILIIINSLSSFLNPCLSSIQVFGVLLFFCICVLTRDYNKNFLILVLGFVLAISLIAKIKFHYLFSPEKANSHRLANPLFVLVFLISAVCAWALFENIPLGRISAPGYLKDEGLTGYKESPEEKVENIITDEERIQGALTALTFKLASSQEMYQLLGSIQDLIVKETSNAADVSNAEKEIIRVINALLMQEDASSAKVLLASINNYIDRKISENLFGIKEEILKATKDNHIGLMQRFSMLSSANKMQYSVDSKELEKSSAQFKQALDSQYIAPGEKKKFSQLAGQLKEWKSYELYRKNLASLEKGIKKLKENKKQEFDDLASRITDSNGNQQLNSLLEKLGELAKDKGLSPEETKAVNASQEAVNLKKEMLKAKENSQLIKKLEKIAEKPGYKETVADILDSIEGETKDKGEAGKKISALIENLGQLEESGASEEIKDMLKEKLDSLIKESSDSIKKQVQGLAVPNDSPGQILKDLEKIGVENNKNKVQAQSRDMQRLAEDIFKQGAMSKKDKDELVEEIKSLEQLTGLKAELTQSEKVDEKDAQAPLDYKQEVSDLLDKSSLENPDRQLMEKLIDKLANSRTVSEVEDVLESLERQMSSSAKKGSKEIQKISELIQNAAQEKKEILKASGPQSAQRQLMDKMMDKLQGAQTVSQVEDVLDSLNQEKSSKLKKENQADIQNINELIQKAAEAKKDLLKSSSLPEQDRELADKLLEKLADSQSVSQVEGVLDSLDREKSLKKDNPDTQNIKELIQKAGQAKNDLLTSSSLAGQDRLAMDKLMDKLADSKSVPQVEDLLDLLNKEKSSQLKENNREMQDVNELIQKAAAAKKGMLENSLLEEQDRQLMENLMERLTGAKTVSEVEAVLTSINQQLSKGEKKETKEFKKIKELIQQAADVKKMLLIEKDSLALRKKIEQLKEQMPQQADALEKDLDTIRQSKDKESLMQNTENFYQKFDEEKLVMENKKELPEPPKEKKEKEQDLSVKIYILPAYAVMPLDSDIRLKSISVYNNLIRDLGTEIEWFSDNPAVAFVDRKGSVKALSVGQAIITCRYKGAMTAKCKITVVQEIPYAAVDSIRKELEKNR